MILRKPYALLIKYFKVIHLFVCFVIGYLIYKTSSVLNFFNTYTSSVESVVGQSTIKDLLSGVSIVLPLLIVIISIAVIYLMRYKKKPVLFYLITILSYLFTTGVFYYANGILNSMYIQVVDIRIALLVRDLITAVMILEWFTLIIFAVRATGFDIKKFNFGQDLEELNVDAKDREEFEINIEIDTDKLKRGWNRNLRHGKYIYKENKYLINVILAVIIVGGLGYGIYRFGFKNKALSENTSFFANGFTLQITGSYITDKAGNGTVIDKNNAYVLITMNVTNGYTTERKFDTARPVLVVGGKKYYSDYEKAELLEEFGEAYYGETLDTKPHDYLFIYEIPKKETLKSMQFQYIDEGTEVGEYDITRIALNPIDLTGNKQEKAVKLGKTIEFEDSILQGSTLKINQIQIADKFQLKYNFCISDNECIPSTEYLTPTVDEYEKYILKVNGTFKLGKDAKIESLSLAKLLERYGKLVYTIDGKEKETNIALKEVRPKRVSLKDEGYVEVLSEVKDASKIDLKLSVYDTTYTYHLK